MDSLGGLLRLDCERIDRCLYKAALGQARSARTELLSALVVTNDSANQVGEILSPGPSYGLKTRIVKRS